MAQWCLFGFSTLSVITRLAVRRWQRKWSFWVSDALLVLALLPFLALVTGDTYLLSTGRFPLDPPTSSGWAKWKFASSVIFDFSLYLPRFSLLAFYYELFPVSEPRLRTGLYIVSVYTFCAFLQAVFMDAFWCGLDVQVNWSMDPTACAMWQDIVPLYINWPIGIAAELLVFILPFGIFPSLKSLHGREKAGLMCIFLLGAATVIVSVARFILIVRGLFLYTTCKPIIMFQYPFSH
ncbi:hypothetical protein EDB81DRAFT_934396 [Dactylonectria macrodidyma]|uniref:Rhodopsin domain-containing protein n=1 Tax=Dactylonectria macrodidyma TaxID=307937 RepID=A0A9P9EWI7_9HYPO|nr:hypothetical protein EDB81DRAFT_934396 [Dactylonectria macrodidyma]